MNTRIDFTKPTTNGAQSAHAAPTWSTRLVSVPATWIQTAPPPREYLMRDVRTGQGAIAARGVCLFVAAGGSGKSYATVAAALAIATGFAWLGTLVPETAGRTLLVSAEEPADELRRRIHHVASALGIKEIPNDSIDVIDVHDVHLPLLDADANETEHAQALLDLVASRGPYSLVVFDPLARLAGAPIDADNRAACALITTLERVASAARGLVIAVHHTSLTARRAGTTDATAIRGATGLGDSARMVLTLGVEELAGVDSQLSELVTLRRAKANHVAKWEPIELRRGDHGVLMPLDAVDLALITEAKQSVNHRKGATAAREAEREQTRNARAQKDAERRVLRGAEREAETRQRDADDDDAARDCVSRFPNAPVRDLVAHLKASRACGSTRAHAAVQRVRGET